jgi:hypothetical protein
VVLTYIITAHLPPLCKLYILPDEEDENRIQRIRLTAAAIHDRKFVIGASGQLSHFFPFK